VLSHGKMKGAPPMDAHNDAQGWLSHDHISPTGPSVCVGAQAFKDVFPDKTVQAKSRTVEREKMEDAKNPNVICRFECLMKGKGEGMLARSKAAPCTDKSGRKIDVRVGPVPRGECVVSGLMSLTMKVSDMETRAMEECKAFAKAQEKSADGVHSTCGYKVKLIKEIVDKEENWTENMNDSSYRSANSKTEKKKSALRRKDTPE